MALIRDSLNGRLFFDRGLWVGGDGRGRGYSDSFGFGRPLVIAWGLSEAASRRNGMRFNG